MLLRTVIVSSERREEGQMEPGTNTAVLSGAYDSAGAGGRARLRGSPSQRGSTLDNSLPQFYSWCCVLRNSSSLIPRPRSAFRASQSILSETSGCSQPWRGLSPHQPEVFSAPGVVSVWIGARAGPCLTPSQSSPGLEDAYGNGGICFKYREAGN